MPILTLPQLIEARPFINHPLPEWMAPAGNPKRGRARITSRHKSRNPSRSGDLYKGEETDPHEGNDYCYPKIAGDPASRCEGRYTTPADTPCFAGCFGFVQKTRDWIRSGPEKNNGANCWVNIFTGPSADESTGWRHLCHHLTDVMVERGMWVTPTTIVGWFGEESPCSLPHLHHELSPYNSYETEDSALLFESYDVPMLEWPQAAEPEVLTRDRALIAWDRAMELARIEFVRRLG